MRCNMTEDVLTDGKMKGSPKGKKTGIAPIKPPSAPLSQKQIQSKAEQLAAQHIKDIQEARANLVKDMVSAGYKPEEWVICDNLIDIQQGKTLEYSCWASKAMATKL